MKLVSWITLTLVVITLFGCANPNRSSSSLNVSSVASSTSSSIRASAASIAPSPIPTVALPTATATIPMNTPTPQVIDAAGATAADQQAYEGASQGNGVAYTGSIDPTIYSQPPAILISLAQGLHGIDLGQSTGMSYRDLKFQALQSDGTWALVRVSGYVKLLNFGLEEPVDGVDVLHRVKGRWYLTAPQFAPPNVGQAQQTAESAAIADAYTRTLRDVDKAIEDGDNYIAAAMLRNALLRYPGNSQAVAKLAAITSQAPGGVVILTPLQYGETGGTYYPFGKVGTPSKIPNVPDEVFGHKGSLQITADGRELIQEECGLEGDDTRVTDIASGKVVVVPAQGDRSLLGCGTHSRDGKIVLKARDLHTGEVLPQLLVMDPLHGGDTQKVCDLTEEQSNAYHGVVWSPDGNEFSMIRYNIQPSNSKVLVGNVASKSCREVSIPGMTDKTAVIPIPGGAGFWIITENQLLVANPQGKGITKVADLPKDLGKYVGSQLGSLDPGNLHVIGPKDGSVVFIGGYLISPKTGRVQPIMAENQEGGMRPIGAVSWLDGGLPQAKQASLTVSPASGPLGTRFGFQLMNGPGGQKVYWSIASLKDSTAKTVAGGSVVVGSDGTISDNGQEGGFGAVAALDWPPGPYRVSVSLGDQQGGGKAIATAEFAVTE